MRLPSGLAVNKGGNAVIRPLQKCKGRFCYEVSGKARGQRGLPDCEHSGGKYMIRLRPYKPGDAFPLVEWWSGASEEEFLKWSCEKFTYPLAIEELDGYFSDWCLRENTGWLMTALDEKGEPVGHFLLRLADYEEDSVRMGFIVVAPRVRGTGCGKEMMEKALLYAFEILGMKKVTLAVFENNPAAKKCYEAAGFREKSYVPDYLTRGGVNWGAFEMEAVRHE